MKILRISAYISTQDKCVGFNVLNTFVRKEVFRFNELSIHFKM